METKAAPGLKELDDKGQGLATIATLEVVDSDKDMTLPGFFGRQDAPMHPAHVHNAPAIGKGVVYEEDSKALYEFRMNLKADHGRAWYETLRFDLEHPPALQEWSYGFNLLDGGSKRGEHEGMDVRFLQPVGGGPGVDVVEVSPVVLGSGVGTGTTLLKSTARGDDLHDLVAHPFEVGEESFRCRWCGHGGTAEVHQLRPGTVVSPKDAPFDGSKAAIAPHSTPTTDAAWDVGAANRALPSERVALRGAHAWVDPDGDPDAKTSYKFNHHQGGSANVRACTQMIANLNGGRTPPNIPDADRTGVWRHAARHLTDADREPPELRDAPVGDMKFSEQAAAVMAGVSDLLGRVSEIGTLRHGKGKTLGEEATELLSWLRDDLEGLDVLLRHFSEPPTHASQEALRWQALGIGIRL